MEKLNGWGKAAVTAVVSILATLTISYFVMGGDVIRMTAEEAVMRRDIDTNTSAIKHNHEELDALKLMVGKVDFKINLLLQKEGIDIPAE